MLLLRSAGLIAGRSASPHSQPKTQLSTLHALADLNPAATMGRLRTRRRLQTAVVTHAAETAMLPFQAHAAMAFTVRLVLPGAQASGWTAACMLEPPLTPLLGCREELAGLPGSRSTRSQGSARTRAGVGAWDKAREMPTLLAALALARPPWRAQEVEPPLHVSRLTRTQAKRSAHACTRAVLLPARLDSARPRPHLRFPARSAEAWRRCPATLIALAAAIGHSTSNAKPRTRAQERSGANQFNLLPQPDRPRTEALNQAQ